MKASKQAINQAANQCLFDGTPCAG